MYILPLTCAAACVHYFIKCLFRLIVQTFYIWCFICLLHYSLVRFSQFEAVSLLLLAQPYFYVANVCPDMVLL